MILEVNNSKNIGKKKATLLFVHGICHGAWAWKNFMDYFSSRGYDCYALSLRGHGGSEGRDQLDSFTLDDYVQDVIDVLAQIREDTIVIGHSMGGGVLQKLIGEHPGHAKAAVMFASIPPCGMNEQVATDMISRAPKGAFDLIKVANDEPITIEEIAACPFFGGRVPLEEVKQYAELLQPDSKIVQESLYHDIATNYDIDIPVAVIGSSNDHCFNDRETRLVAEAYGTEAIMIKELCHDMMVDPEWEKAAEVLLSAIERINAS